MISKTAVVLDKQRGQRDEIRSHLSRCGVLPICFKDEWICLENVHHIKPGFALLRTNSYERAFRFVNVARAIRSDFPIVVLSDQSKIEGLIRNNWLANLIFLRYPANHKEFQIAIERLAQVQQVSNVPVLIAASPERKRVMQELPLLALAREPILIEGEPGVGKKQIARAIHGFSSMKDAEIEFIGARDISARWIREAAARVKHAKQGAGVVPIRIITNVETLPHSLQSQLLLILDEVNGSGRAHDHVHRSAPFISLAGGELEPLVTRGAFRKDLYHRLSVLKINVPSLSGHADDIRAMAESFAARYGIEQNGGIYKLPATVLDDFATYHWPGNITELKQSVKRAISNPKTDRIGSSAQTCEWDRLGNVQQGTNDWIDVEDLRRYIQENSELSLKKAKTRYAAQVEKKLMRAALIQTKGNCKKAATLLNISYKSMLNKAKVYHLV